MSIRSAVVPFVLLSGFAVGQTWENETPLATHVGKGSGHQFGWIGVRAGDVDNDGIEDYMITAPNLGGTKGRVLVYSGATGAKLWGATGQAGENLGRSGSAAGELNGDAFDEYMAGAPNLAAGAAYVWSGVDGSLLHTLTGEVAGDTFGTSVGHIGDVDGDLIGDLAVGAPTNDAAGLNAGRVYLYSGTDGSLIRSIDGRAAGQQFGGSLAGVGDRNGDGVPDVLVGAPTGGAAGTGIAYVVSGADGTTIWTLTGDTKSANFSQFFLGPCGDVNADSIEDLFVSDFGNSAKGANTGRAFIFNGTDGALLYTITGEKAGDGFSIGRGWAGDINGDGHDDLVFGHWTNNQGGLGAGRCSVFSGKDGSHMLSWTGDAVGVNLGFDAAGIGDLDGDGITDFLFTGAGANQSTGVAYVFSSRDPQPPQRFCTPQPNSAGAGAVMNYRLSTSLSKNQFRLRSSGTPPDVASLYFFSFARKRAPFVGGTLCVQGPVFRLGPVQTTSSSGTLNRPLDFAQAPLATSGLGGAAGYTAHFQLAYRDPAAGGSGKLKLSDGLSVTFQP